MKPLLLFTVIILDTVQCHSHTNIDSLDSFFDRKDKFFSDRDTEEERGDQTFQDSPITILEVQREVLEDNIKYAVKYESTVTPVKVNWTFIVEKLGTTNTEADQGVYETSAFTSLPLPTEYQEKPTLLLTTPDGRESMILILEIGAENAVKTDIPVPRLDIEPTGDFVYEEGEDFTFKFRIPKTFYHDYGNGSSSVYGTESNQVILDLETGDVHWNDFEKYFHGLERKVYENYEEHTVQMKTSVSRISGVISIVSKFWTDVDFVSAVRRIKEVVIRPSIQDGPFPDGFLDIIKYPYHEESEEIYCGVGDQCTSLCMAVGEGITQLKVERLQADGSVGPSEDQSVLAQVSHYLIPYVLEKGVGFKVNSISEDPEKIRCTARNAEGKVVTMETPVVFYVPVDIIEEESGIEVISDQDDANLKHATLYCTVKGEPRPNVTFNYGSMNLDYEYFEGKYDAVPEEIVLVGDMTYKMIIHVTIYGDESTYGPYYYFQFADCDAKQESPIWIDEFNDLIP